MFWREEKMKKFMIKGVFLILVSVVLSSNMFAQTRIKFAKGGTSATVSRQISGYGEKRFVLTARYGQVLSANVSSRNGCVKFSNGATSLTYITQAGNNRIYLINSCRSQTGFSITVSINYGSD